MLVEVDENLISKTAQVISKDYIHISVIEDIKAEIGQMKDYYEREYGYQNASSEIRSFERCLKIIDKHISGKENE